MYSASNPHPHPMERDLQIQRDRNWGWPPSISLLAAFNTILTLKTPTLYREKAKGIEKMYLLRVDNKIIFN